VIGSHNHNFFLAVDSLLGFNERFPGVLVDHLGKFVIRNLLQGRLVLVKSPLGDNGDFIYLEWHVCPFVWEKQRASLVGPARHGLQITELRPRRWSAVALQTY